MNILGSEESLSTNWRCFHARPLYLCIVEQPDSWRLLTDRFDLALYRRALRRFSPTTSTAELVGSLYIYIYSISLIWHPDSPSLYLSLTAFHNDKLLLRRCPGKHNFCMVKQDVIQLLASHVLQIWAMNHTSFGIPANKRQCFTSQEVFH